MLAFFLLGRGDLSAGRQEAISIGREVCVPGVFEWQTASLRINQDRLILDRSFTGMKCLPLVSNIAKTGVPARGVAGARLHETPRRLDFLTIPYTLKSGFSGEKFNDELPGVREIVWASQPYPICFSGKIVVATPQMALLVMLRKAVLQKD